MMAALQSRPRIAWALGGGGVRGFAHLGVLKVLQEEGVPVDALAGTSMGAVVAALFAAETDLKYLTALAARIAWEDFVDLRFPRYGLVEGKRLVPLIRLLTKRKKLEELAIPVRIIATDLLTGEEVVFTQGPLDLAVRASISIPGVFTPVPYGKHLLVDGGLVAGVPVKAAAAMGMDLVFAVYVAGDLVPEPPRSVFDILYRSSEIMMHKLDGTQLQQAAFILAPEVGDVGTLQFSRVEERIAKGEAAARKALPALKRIIADFQKGRGKAAGDRA
ncbi:MAG: patatin-like phospholipase family protein [Firmicutes bacterium]|nr:patatin-like phospholipase family protein [Bacillota bacterium]